MRLMLLFDSLSSVFIASSLRCNLLRAEIYTDSFLHILSTVAARHMFCHTNKHLYLGDQGLLVFHPWVVWVQI